MSAEALPPPESDNFPVPERRVLSPLIDEYTESISDIWTPNTELTEFNRPGIAIATALFIRQAVQMDSALLNANGHQGHPLIPELHVNRSIQSIWEEIQARPLQKIEIARHYSNALKRSARVRYFSFQIFTTLDLANELKQAEHPLAPCASDVLLGYGKTLSELKH
jgi:hypothetical protein